MRMTLAAAICMLFVQGLMLPFFTNPTVLRAETLEECAAIADEAQRVACYVRVAGRAPSKPVSAEAAACDAPFGLAANLTCFLQAYRYF